MSTKKQSIHSHMTKVAKAAGHGKGTMAGPKTGNSMKGNSMKRGAC